MVRITPSKRYEIDVKHLDRLQKDRLEKLIRKIIQNPRIGKPLKYKRGERIIYLKPFRLVYAVRGEELILFKFDHRKRVYQ